MLSQCCNAKLRLGTSTRGRTVLECSKCYGVGETGCEEFEVNVSLKQFGETEEVSLNIWAKNKKEAKDMVKKLKVKVT